MRQPQCKECNHPLSFHANRAWCCATGCRCEQWVEPEKKKPPAKSR